MPNILIKTNFQRQSQRRYKEIWCKFVNDIKKVQRKEHKRTVESMKGKQTDGQKER
jgi:hypothetical protein